MKKKIVLKPVEFKGDDGTYNLDADAANADPIRAARLLKAGKLKELKKLEETHMGMAVEEG